jgi:adenylosuccinate lyase
MMEIIRRFHISLNPSIINRYGRRPNGQVSAHSFELSALSPLDGRYASQARSLREYFSEFAFIRDRLRVEVEYLLALAQNAHLTRSIKGEEQKLLRGVVAGFTPGEAQQIKVLESTTHHDAKAIEYYLREKLASSSLVDLVELVHVGLTSEDLNQTAQALSLRDSRDAVMLPALELLLAQLSSLAREYRSTPLLARTHGQPAVPTTLGKELAVFVSRLKKQRLILRKHLFEAKLSGAVGNLNSLAFAAPQVDWLNFSRQFVRSLGLEPSLVTTQLLPYDNWVYYFDAIRLTNSILLDLAQDAWRYISDDYLTLRVVASEVGSSTMPQKVNPIDLENAEGNLGIANALFAHYAVKLPVSRLQRDLSDSTVRRTFGVALGHTLVAWASLSRGLGMVRANEAKMLQDLQEHWEVVAEGAQSILRLSGVPGAYEMLKGLTRGKRLTRGDFEAWIDGLNIAEGVRAKLHALTPFSYLGLAEKLVDEALAQE